MPSRKLKIALLDPNFGADYLADEILADGYKLFRIGQGRGRRQRDFGEEFFIDIDYSNTVQVQGVLEGLKVDSVIPGATDKSFHSWLEITKRGEPYGPTANPRELDFALDKLSLSRLLSELEVRHPLTVDTTGIDLSDQFFDQPIVVKPSDSFSGRGISILCRPEETLLALAIQEARRFSESNRVLVQRYISGPLFSGSAFFVQGVLVQLHVVREKCLGAVPAVNLSYVSTELEPESIFLLTQTLEKVARATGKESGLLHSQFIVGPQGPEFIEVFERLPGDLYGRLIEISTGFPFHRAYLAGYIPISLVNKRTERGAYCRVTTTRGQLNRYLQSSASNQHKVYEVKAVRRLRPPESGPHQPEEVILFLEFRTPEELQEWAVGAEKTELFR